MSPLRLWDLALRKYRVLQRLEQQYNDAQITQDAKLQAEAEAFAQAVHALRKLQTAEAAKKLEEYQRWADGHGGTLKVPHSSKLLNTYAPNWWVYCFTELFFRGDFHELKYLGLPNWTRMLLRRRDFYGWACSKEFAATAWNIHQRRRQMYHVYDYTQTSDVWKSVQEDLHSLEPRDIVASALAATNCSTLQRTLRDEGIVPKVKNVLRSMDVALRNLEGTESYAAGFRYKYTAMRLWNGCSLVFFTINPHDIHAPLLLYYVGDRDTTIGKISLDWDDDQMASFYDEHKQGSTGISFCTHSPLGSNGLQREEGEPRGRTRETASIPGLRLVWTREGTARKLLIWAS